MNKKIKILTISDHPLSPSGVGLQTRYMIEAMLKTGKYSFFSIGGAVKHNDYRLQKTEEWGDDFLILPVDGYGDQNLIRQLIEQVKPDILWFMTDPRFYHWLWEIEDEVRCKVPMVYYHVWDNKPYPNFNKPSYLSNDVIVTISKVTDDIVRHVAPEVETHYIPHSVDLNIFKKMPDNVIEDFRKKVFAKDKNKKFTVFWNSRNARRKNPGTVVWWFNDFLKLVGKDKATLLMHTDPKDPHGPDLEAIINELGLTNGEVMFSNNRIDSANLTAIYNLADVTVSLSDAEGFGLSTMESLACEVPIVVPQTGGLQEQVKDEEGNYFGIELPITSQMVVGSQDVPYIYEDRVGKEDFVNALLKLFKMPSTERQALGAAGRAHLIKNYNMPVLMSKWDEVLSKVYTEHGSWDDRKGYSRWTLKEIA
jgi:glycosyltransferase involved in cell wall biosynthesis